MDLTVQLEDRPGELARLGETLGAAGINLIGFTATRIGGVGEIHLLVDDPAAARQALKDAGIQVSSEREMVVLPVEERPGELGRAARTLADAGVNIELAYPAETGLAFGVDDPDRARGAL
ncbi:MAG: ACT domain-containing protein [Actinomycetota bacterium]